MISYLLVVEQHRTQIVIHALLKCQQERSEERFSRNAETDLVCRLLLEKKYLTQPRGRGVGGGAPMPSGEQQTPGGWNRIHLLVDDLDANIARLKAAGARFHNEVVQGTGGKQILLEDPSGNLVELFEANTAAYRAPGSGSKA